MRTIVKNIFIALILVALAFGFYWFKLRDHSIEEEFKIYGNVEVREAEAAFRQSGRISEILVDEGSVVKKGDLLATIDVDTFSQALSNIDAEIAVANAELAKLNSGTRAEEIALAQANVRQAEAIYRNADDDYRRQMSLLPSGAVSEKLVHGARASRDVAKANFDAANSTLLLKRNGPRSEDITVGQRRVQAIQASRRKMETALEDTRLVAPVDGIISARSKEVGALVSPANTVFSISIRSAIYVRAYVSEPMLGRAAVGTLVQLSTDSKDKIYHGRVAFVSPRAEFTPKTVETEDLRSDQVYRIRIIVTDADSALLQGMPVTVTVASTKPIDR
jgi:HlyD family secretion protein